MRFFYFESSSAENFLSGVFGHGEHDGDIKKKFDPPKKIWGGGQNFEIFYFSSWNAENFHSGVFGHGEQDGDIEEFV